MTEHDLKQMQQPFGFLDTLQHLAEMDEEDRTDAEDAEI
jgi:hypothetical protein